MLKKLLVLFVAVAAVAFLGFAVERSTSSAPVNEPAKAAPPDKVYGSGTVGKLAVWTDTDRIGDSAITQDTNSRLGIGSAPNPNGDLFIRATNPAITYSALFASNPGVGRGITGSSFGGIGVNGIGVVGVNGITSSTNPVDAAVRGIATFGPGTAKAGLFQGDVQVTGTLIKSAGSFRIDHPLDPERKYLSHSFVESPDMMNVYNGNVTTDADGNATVVMPDYFEALNRDFRYQLTVIGKFAQAMVSEKISKNAFKIKTDKPGTEVSWQVTGIRKDKFANENRIPVETMKP